VIEAVEITYPRARTCVVALHGEHDRGTSERMEELFRRIVAANDLVVVDVGDADFIDSSFLRNLLVADRDATEQQKLFRLQMGTAPIVRRALEVSGVLERLAVVYNREDALALPDDTS
jgi:anti-anti-sigma factor